MNSVDFSGIVFDTKGGCTVMQSAYQVPASVLCNMYHDDRFHDVTLCGVPAPGMQLTSLSPIRAHKAVLAHASSHLYDLFTADGFIDSHLQHYNILNVDHESLRRIVEFVHTDKLAMNEADAVDVVCGVLAGAKYLIMKNRLVDACEAFLANEAQVKPDNCIELWCFARKHNCLTLMEATAKFIADSLNDVLKSGAFLNMPYADCAKLFLSEALIAANADARCQAAFAWLNYGSGDGRANYVHDVMNMIPFTSGSVLADTILQANECDILWKHTPGSLRVVIAKTFKKIKLDYPTLPIVAPSGRSSASCRAWYVIGDDENKKQFLKYDVDGRFWSTLPSLPWRRKHAAACAVGSRLIVIGGRKEDGLVTADVDEYDLASDAWLTGHARLTQARSSLSACSDDQNAYVLGGWGVRQSLDVVDSYSLDIRNKAVKLAALSSRRHSCASSFSTAHNAIIAAGGRADRAVLSTIDKYDVAGDTWAKVGDLTEARSHLASVFAGNADDLYLIGGGNDVASKTVEIFNVRTGQNPAAPGLLNARCCSAITMFQNNVVAVLGGNSTPAVETYDVREGKWSAGVIVPDMPAGCSEFAFAAT